MADLKQSVEWMKEGKGVRRFRMVWVLFIGSNGLEMMDPRTNEKKPVKLSLGDLEATDWEIYGGGELMNQEDSRKSKEEWASEEEDDMRRFGYDFKERNTNNEIIFKKALTKREETSSELLKRLGMDGKKWTDEFMKINKEKNISDDWGTMIGWFCSAIMTGYDYAKQESPTTQEIGYAVKEFVDWCESIPAYKYGKSVMPPFREKAIKIFRPKLT